MNLYTVEQIELIRRLRKTGIQAHQIAEAFRSLDRLEQDLGIFGGSSLDDGLRSQNRPDSSSSSSFAKSPAISPSVPTSREADSSAPSILRSAKTEPKSENRTSITAGSSSLNNINASSMPVLLQHLTTSKLPRSSVDTTAMEQRNNGKNTGAPSVIQGTKSGGTNSLSRLDGRTSETTSTGLYSTQSIFPDSMTYDKPISQANGSLRAPTESDRRGGSNETGKTCIPFMEWSTVTDKEFEGFLQGRDEMESVQEMKTFVNQMQIRQTTIARMTGVSQPYVSKFLNGNSRELSRRVRLLLLKWYLAAKTNPEKIAQFCASEPFIPKLDLSATQQRRERYVFRPVLIQILEHFFLQHQYPDLQKRMEIASNCNRVLAAEKQGGVLMKKEHVTPQIIANWFANKRKDNKRRIQLARSTSAGMDLITKSGTSIIEGNAVEFQDGGGGALISPSPSNSGFFDETEVNSRDGRSSESSTEEVSVAGRNFRNPQGILTEDSLSLLHSQLAAVNSSVMALVNPYDESVKMESE